jgi:hypothetical protein
LQTKKLESVSKKISCEKKGGEIMGRNFYLSCHKCKEKLFLFRDKESKALHWFYDRHENCMKIDKNNVECLDDCFQEKNWMCCDDKKYKDVESIYKKENSRVYCSNCKLKINNEVSNEILNFCLCGKCYEKLYWNFQP